MAPDLLHLLESVRMTGFHIVVAGALIVLAVQAGYVIIVMGLRFAQRLPACTLGTALLDPGITLGINGLAILLERKFQGF